MYQHITWNFLHLYKFCTLRSLHKMELCFLLEYQNKTSKAKVMSPLQI